MIPRGDVLTGAYFSLAMIAPTLLPLKLKSRESMMRYNHQRILRQLGSPRAVWIVGNTCMSIWEAESLFVGNGRYNILTSFTIMFWLILAREGVRSPGGTLHWMRFIELLNTFMSQDNKDPLVCAMPVMVFVRDPLLRVRRTTVARPYPSIKR